MKATLSYPSKNLKRWFKLLRLNCTLFILALSLSGCSVMQSSDVRSVKNTPITAIKNDESNVSELEQKCPQNVKSCAFNVICIGARTKPYTKSSNPAYWSELPIFKKYAAEARRRGWSCSGYS